VPSGEISQLSAIEGAMPLESSFTVVSWSNIW
jgi:hypothetical protein